MWETKMDSSLKKTVGDRIGWILLVATSTVHLALGIINICIVKLNFPCIPRNNNVNLPTWEYIMSIIELVFSCLGFIILFTLTMRNKNRLKYDNGTATMGLCIIINIVNMTMASMGIPCLINYQSDCSLISYNIWASSLTTIIMSFTLPLILTIVYSCFWISE